MLLHNRVPDPLFFRQPEPKLPKVLPPSQIMLCAFRCRYSEARLMSQTALDALSGRGASEKSPELADALVSVAHAAALLGTPAELQLAEEHTLQALGLREALFGRSSLEVAACQHMLAVIYLKLDRCDACLLLRNLVYKCWYLSLTWQSCDVLTLYAVTSSYGGYLLIHQSQILSRKYAATSIPSMQ